MTYASNIFLMNYLITYQSISKYHNPFKEIIAGYQKSVDKTPSTAVLNGSTPSDPKLKVVSNMSDHQM